MKSTSTRVTHWTSGVVLALLIHGLPLIYTANIGMGTNLDSPSSIGKGGAMQVGFGMPHALVTKRATANTSKQVHKEAQRKNKKTVKEVRSMPLKKSTIKNTTLEPKAVPAKVVSKKESTVNRETSADINTLATGGMGGPSIAGGQGHESIGGGFKTGFGAKSRLKMYKRTVHEILMRAKRYPSAARRAGEQGAVVVSFQIHPGGSCSNIKVVKTSPYWLLNREGQQLIKRVGRFPPIPADVSSTSMNFTVKIPFRLR